MPQLPRRQRLRQGQTLNGVGFNMVDSEIGHSLARCNKLSLKQANLGRRICRKYGRQLRTEMVEAMG
jgi:hypothetical protein